MFEARALSLLGRESNLFSKVVTLPACAQRQRQEDKFRRYFFPPLNGRDWPLGYETIERAFMRVDAGHRIISQSSILSFKIGEKIVVGARPSDVTRAPQVDVGRHIPLFTRRLLPHGLDLRLERMRSLAQSG